MRKKQVFKTLFLILALILVFLPFVTTFNSVLTGLFNRLGFYRVIQSFLVPFESRFVVLVVRLFAINAYLGKATDTASFYLLQNGQYLPVRLEWNCLGWQSMLLLAISFIVGLQGNFTKLSMIECVVTGILGTFLVNIFRMVFVTVGIYYVNQIFGLVLHDYLAALVTVLWLMWFWRFSYKYILEEKQDA